MFCKKDILSHDKIDSIEPGFDPSNTTSDQNKTIEMQRITQPSDRSQHVERALTAANTSLDRTKSDFRPSPQLETYYEFNKIPVPPALPEAKQFSHYNIGPWSDRSLPPAEQAWTTRVKFPATVVPTVKDRPYPFYNENGGSTGKSYNVPITETHVQKPLNKIPTVDEWNQFIATYEKPKVINNQFDLTSSERPVINNGGKVGNFDFTAPVVVPPKTGYDVGTVEKIPSHEVQGSPWKKIIKFLTAFIPIGLLISALTPTVITVSSVNGTQSRYRAEDSGNHPANKLISSLNYFNKRGCEDRILCELLLSATTTQNSEQHIQNLLDTFVENGKAVEKAEEMKRIFTAVKSQDCKPIICRSMKEKT